MADPFRSALDAARPARNSHAQVVDGVGAAIIQGRHAPGSLLPRDEELAARFGVSRTVLREAVKTLTARGFLVARSRVGTRVRPPDAWSMFDADVLGWHLEGGAGLLRRTRGDAPRHRARRGRAGGGARGRGHGGGDAAHGRAARHGRRPPRL